MPSTSPRTSTHASHTTGRRSPLPAIPFDSHAADAWARTQPSALDLLELPTERALNPNQKADWLHLGWSDTAASELAALDAQVQQVEPALAKTITATASQLQAAVPGTAQVARHHWGKTMHAACTTATEADVIHLRGSLAITETQRRHLAAQNARDQAAQSAARLAAQLRRSHTPAKRTLLDATGRPIPITRAQHEAAAAKARLWDEAKWASIAVGTMLIVGFVAGIAAGKGWL